MKSSPLPIGATSKGSTIAAALASLDRDALVRVVDGTELNDEEVADISEAVEVLDYPLRQIAELLLARWSSLSAQERVAGLLYLAEALGAPTPS